MKYLEILNLVEKIVYQEKDLLTPKNKNDN